MNRLKRLSVPSLVLGAAWLFASIANAAVVNLTPSRDVSIVDTGDIVNGAGWGNPVGVTNTGEVTRYLLRFDLSSIPAGSTINSADLELQVLLTTTTPASPTLDLHRLSQDWGDALIGGSFATSPNGPITFSAATAGMVSWISAFTGAAAWTTAGGDFAGTASASVIGVASTGPITFSGAALESDVQGFVDTPATNFGWIIKAQNEAVSAAGRILGTLENGSAGNRPTLMVDFTAPAGTPSPTPTSTPAPTPTPDVPVLGGTGGGLLVALLSLLLLAALSRTGQLHRAEY